MKDYTREDTTLTYDPFGYDWIKSYVADHDELRTIEAHCDKCGSPIEISVDRAAEEAFISYGAEDEWDTFTDDLGHLLDNLSPEREYIVHGSGMGWRQRSGDAEISLPMDRPSGTEFLRQVMPNTEFHLWLWATDEKGKLYEWDDKPISYIFIEISHHDAPMGGEVYQVMKLVREEEEE